MFHRRSSQRGQRPQVEPWCRRLSSRQHPRAERRLHLLGPHPGQRRSYTRTHRGPSGLCHRAGVLALGEKLGVLHGAVLEHSSGVATSVLVDGHKRLRDKRRRSACKMTAGHRRQCVAATTALGKYGGTRPRNQLLRGAELVERSLQPRLGLHQLLVDVPAPDADREQLSRLADRVDFVALQTQPTRASPLAVAEGLK